MGSSASSQARRVEPTPAQIEAILRELEDLIPGLLSHEVMHGLRIEQKNQASAGAQATATTSCSSSMPVQVPTRPGSPMSPMAATTAAGASSTPNSKSTNLAVHASSSLHNNDDNDDESFQEGLTAFDTPMRVLSTRQRIHSPSRRSLQLNLSPKSSSSPFSFSPSTALLTSCDSPKHRCHSSRHSSSSNIAWHRANPNSARVPVLKCADCGCCAHDSDSSNFRSTSTSSTIVAGECTPASSVIFALSSCRVCRLQFCSSCLADEKLLNQLSIERLCFSSLDPLSSSSNFISFSNTPSPSSSDAVSLARSSALTICRQCSLWILQPQDESALIACDLDSGRHVQIFQ